MSTERVDQVIREGYVQLSRKYRLLGKLPEGKTGLEALREKDPRLAQHFLDQANRWARDAFLSCFGEESHCCIELTEEEFDEYLVKTGRYPMHGRKVKL